MRQTRSQLLQLIALGRITPAEAERLLIAWNQGRESAWIMAACVAATLLMHWHPQAGLAALAHIAHPIVAGTSVHRALTLATRILGGLQ